MDYNSWIANLRDVLQEQDRPLSLRNGRWETKDRIALWKEFSSRVFDLHLDLLKELAVEVLSEIDPRFELPAEKRYAASIHGQTLNYSSELREGLAETLALLGNYGNKLTNCSQHKPETTALLAIREILGNTDWRLWGSLNYLLPTLAEACPNEFLSTVEKALHNSPCPFDELFKQEGNGLSGGNYTSGLLWALEGLAWSKEYLVQVTVILAELASLSPVGNFGKRPGNSLSTILLPWYPQTLAPIDKRISCIKAIKHDFPDIAWDLLQSLLPNQHQTSTGTHKPRWRKFVEEDWKPEVKYQEYRDQVNRYAELSVGMALQDTKKLSLLVDNLHNLPTQSLQAILEHIDSNKITNLSEEQRLPIWTNLTDFIRKHRRFSDAKWTLSENILAQIEKTTKKLSPKSHAGLYKNLFSRNDLDLYEEKGDYKAQKEKLGIKRQNAIKTILNAEDLQGVIKFIDVIDSPSKAGTALSAIANNKIDSYLLPDHLTTEDTKRQQFIGAYVWRRFQSLGWRWVDGLDRGNWSSMQSCHMLMHLPFERNTWHRANEWLGDYEQHYWKKVHVNPYPSSDDPLVAVDMLLDAKRPLSAIDCLNYRLYKKLPLDIKRTVKALLHAVDTKEAIDTIDAHEITDLIKALQNEPQVDQDSLFKIEWAYLPIIDRSSGAKPKLLENSLSTQPDFFCEVIRLVYKSTHKQRKNNQLNKKNRAQISQAWQLLHSWRKPPGLKIDGSFSEEDFQEWLDSVKRQCNNSGHLEVAMIELGEVLYYCPPDPTGLWIAQGAARALNVIDAGDMRNGFSTEAYNSRGVHSVDPTGQAERDIAAKWRQKSEDIENLGFSRFAATLKKLANSYDHEAERVIEEHKNRLK